MAREYTKWKNVENEELLQMLREKAQTLGRNPRSLEMDDRHIYERRFGSWNKALVAAGLTPEFHTKKGWDISDEELISMVRPLFDRIGSTKKNDYEASRGEDLPSSTYLNTRFKGWNNFLIRAGFTKDDVNLYRTSKDEYIRQIRNYVEEHDGRVPTIDEWKAAGYSGQIREIFPTFNDAIIAAGFDPNTVRSSTVTETDEELIQMYVAFSNKLGYPATYNDLLRSPDIYSPNVFTLRFGTLNDLREKAGLDTSRHGFKYDTEELRQMLLDFKRKYGKPTVRTMRELFKKKGMPDVNTFLRHFQVTSTNKLWEKINEESREER
ncbi:homing endonuclease associated repeat-containing protein [Paenibacillus apiarius]|uniref:homing endonuclease associated repeat-containing protein n=1 Tax=Paenibacillus apiarius TaxID=46240 RepID=UPI003B3B116B